jgi:Protein of unknown function (DUF4031)
MIWCEGKTCLWQNSDDTSIHPVFRGRKSAHLMADTDEELITYAESIGMKANWIQSPGTYSAHFDIVGIKLEKVLKDNRVIKLGREEWVEKYRNRRANG